MKKILFFFTPILLVFCFSFPVHAEYMPPVLPDLNTVQLPAFLEEVAMMDMLNLQGVSMESGQLNHLNELINGRTIEQSLNERYVDNADISATMQEFFDSGGNAVPKDDTFTVFGTSDVANYSYVCNKETGEILLSYNEYNELVSTIQAGNGLVNYPSLFPQSSTQQQARIMNEVNTAIGANMIVFGDHVSSEDMEFLSSYEFYMTYTTDDFGYTVYVPNACSSNTVCWIRNSDRYEYTGPVGGSGTGNPGYSWSPIIYTNNPSEVIYSTEGRGNYLINETHTYSGYTFNYVSYIGEGIIPFWKGGYCDFHVPTPSEYSQYRQISDNVVYLIPAENTGDVTNVYNYTYVTEDSTRPSPVINHNYDNRSTTNYNNYPVTNNVSYPDYSTTTNTYVTNIYEYYTTPAIGDSLGQIDDSELTNNIPILSNLRYRFPFSIPFDLYEMGKALAVERQVPILEFSFFIPVIDYDAHIQFDLSPWNDLFVLFRKLELILFIVALAVFSYDHYFGT